MSTREWTVELTNKANKQQEKLSESIRLILQLLAVDLKTKGPSPGKNWANYGKLKGLKKGIDKRHCHLQKGNPTYVVCWEVFKNKKLIEVYYVGTHEKAPY